MSSCLICEKQIQVGNNVSHSQRKTKRKFRPNIQLKTVIVSGVPVKGKVCTKCYKKYQMK